MLGQSMEIVIHISSDPKNTPKTLQASVLSPPAGGMNREPMIMAMERRVKIVSFELFFFIVFHLLLNCRFLRAEVSLLIIGRAPMSNRCHKHTVTIGKS